MFLDLFSCMYVCASVCVCTSMHMNLCCVLTCVPGHTCEGVRTMYGDLFYLSTTWLSTFLWWQSLFATKPSPQPYKDLFNGKDTFQLWKWDFIANFAWTECPVEDHICVSRLPSKKSDSTPHGNITLSPNPVTSSGGNYSIKFLPLNIFTSPIIWLQTTTKQKKTWKP